MHGNLGPGSNNQDGGQSQLDGGRQHLYARRSNTRRRMPAGIGNSRPFKGFRSDRRSLPPAFEEKERKARRAKEPLRSGGGLFRVEKSAEINNQRYFRADKHRSRSGDEIARQPRTTTPRDVGMPCIAECPSGGTIVPGTLVRRLDSR